MSEIIYTHVTLQKVLIKQSTQVATFDLPEPMTWDQASEWVATQNPTPWNDNTSALLNDPENAKRWSQRPNRSQGNDPEIVELISQLTTADVAARLAEATGTTVKPETIAVYHSRGEMPPATKVGRNLVWTCEEIDEWIANRPGRGTGGGRPAR